MAMINTGTREMAGNAASVAFAKERNPGAEVFAVPGDTQYLYGFEVAPDGSIKDFVINRNNPERRIEVRPGAKGYDQVVAQRKQMFPQVGGFEAASERPEARLDEALESAGDMSSPVEEDASGRPVLEAPTFTQVEDRMYVGDKPRAFRKEPGMPEVKMAAADKTGMTGAQAKLAAAETPRQARQVVDQMLGVLENRKGPMDEGLQSIAKQLRGMRKERVGELKGKS